MSSESVCADNDCYTSSSRHDMQIITKTPITFGRTPRELQTTTLTHRLYAVAVQGAARQGGSPVFRCRRCLVPKSVLTHAMPSSVTLLVIGRCLCWTIYLVPRSMRRLLSCFFAVAVNLNQLLRQLGESFKQRRSCSSGSFRCRALSMKAKLFKTACVARRAHLFSYGHTKYPFESESGFKLFGIILR